MAASGDMDAVLTAQQEVEDALEALDDQRRQIEEDLAFSDPSAPEQWTAEEIAQRRSDPGGVRPCLVMDQIGQYIANVAGQIESNPPAVHAIPVDDAADRDVASKLDGIYRHVEYASRAQQHYARALTSAARVGVGYLLVRNEVIDPRLNWQEPRIDSVGDPLRVVFDPDSEQLDGSDASFAYILTPFTEAAFEKRWPGKEKRSFGDSPSRKWSEDKRTLMIAERFGLSDGKVTWQKMSGTEVLEESEFPAELLPVVPLYGYVSWVNGRMKYCGMARRAREPQRAYNFHVSEIRAYMATAPKSPWIVPIEGLDANMKRLWDRANVEQRSYLPYKSRGEDGNPIPPPQRAQPSINLGNHMAGADAALRDIQSALGMYAANLGQPSNETSGVAIESRKQQGEASTAHFSAHLSASVAQVGRIVLDMIPRIVDVPRQLRIVGMDDSMSAVQVDPNLPAAFAEVQGQAVINPGVGRYDVRVVVGPAFSTQRQQAQLAYTEMMRANPQMAPAIAPLWAQSLDVPHADKLAQVLTAMAPPAVRAILQPDEAGDGKAELQAKLQQLGEALQEAIQHAEAAQREADEARAELAANEDKLEIEEDKVAVSAYEAQTRRAQALASAVPQQDVGVLVQQTIEQMLSSPSPWPGERPEGVGEQGEAGQQMPPALQQIMEQQQAIAEQHRTLMEAVAQLSAAVQRPRRRVPVFDRNGDITHVIDQPDDGQAPTMQ